MAERQLDFFGEFRRSGRFLLAVVKAVVTGRVARCAGCGYATCTGYAGRVLGIRELLALFTPGAGMRDFSEEGYAGCFGRAAVRFFGKGLFFRRKALSLHSESAGISYEDVGARNIPTVN